MKRGASIDAIGRVYRERSEDFFRYALATTGDRDVARDAVQEGFTRAIRGRRGFRGTGSLEAWIARCVQNAARDLARRGLVETSDPGDVDVSAASAAETNASVRAAVRRLPRRQRDALFLRFYLDLDYAGIAEVLSIEVGTVSATLHAARENLRREIEEVPN